MKIKVLVTAGPTVEAIDEVRYISNHSSGKQGYLIAEEFAKHGAEVVLVSGPVSIKPPNNVNLYNVSTADEMLDMFEMFASGHSSICCCSS